MYTEHQTRVNGDGPELQCSKGVFALAAAGLNIDDLDMPPPVGRETDADYVWAQWPLADQVRVAKAIIEKNTDRRLYVDWTGQLIIVTTTNRNSVYLTRLGRGWWLIENLPFADTFETHFDRRGAMPSLEITTALSLVRDWKLPRLDRVIERQRDDGDLAVGYHAGIKTLVVDGRLCKVPRPWGLDEWGAAAVGWCWRQKRRRMRGVPSKIITNGSQRAYGPRGLCHTSYAFEKGCRS